MKTPPEELPKKSGGSCSFFHAEDYKGVSSDVQGPPLRHRKSKSFQNPVTAASLPGVQSQGLCHPVLHYCTPRVLHFMAPGQMTLSFPQEPSDAC
jgi:hypothetical protein